MKAPRWNRREAVPATSLFELNAGPGRWIAGDQAFECAPAALKDFPQPFFAAGEFFLRERFRERLIAPLVRAGFDLREWDFPENGECCEPVTAAMADAAQGAGTMLALGGGKCLDSAKLAARRLEIPLVTLPTSAATCACGTSVAVLYNESGVYEDTVDLEKAPDLVLVDLSALARPARLAAAGAIDAAARWLEWLALPPEFRGGFGAEAGGSLAERAWRMVRGGASGEKLVEASLLLSAESANLGAGGAAAAHSLCNGLSLVPAARKLLHGELVGLGLLFQDRLLESLGRPPLEDAGKREAWLAGMNAPVRLPAGTDIEAVAIKTLAAGESIHGIAAGLETARIQELLKGLLPEGNDG